MSNNQDARPFVDLKKDAQEFRIKFDEDIENCLNFLDAKITTLICDPDSFGTFGKNVHQNTLAEFSKAKYDIFISVKSLINAKEREWLNYIAEMKKLFIENVEIFLAGTKLEVKLPPPESVPSYGPKKSPINHKSNPISVTRSIYPIISSITKNIPVIGSSLQDISTSSVSKGYDEEMDVEESVLNRSRSRSSSNSRSGILNNSGLNTSRSSSGRRSSLKKEIIFGPNENISAVLNQTDINVTASVHGRRGKLTKVKPTAENVSVQNSSSTDESEVQISVKEVSLKGRRGRTSQKAKINNSTVTQNSSSTDENENVTTEMPEKKVSLKGRRGRPAQKAKIITAKNSSITDENKALTEIPEKEASLKGRRGRAVQKINSNNSIDSSKDLTVEMINTEIPLKGRRGKLTAEAKINDLTVTTYKNNITDENEGSIVEINKNELPLKGRRGKSAAKSNNAIGKKTAIKGRKSVKSRIEEKIYEAEPSTSKKVSFSEEHSSSDELDVQTPLSRPLKSTARRKTLLPNLEATSGADIIPGNPSRLKAKRKTISAVSELESMIPSKRLKGKQKSSSQEEDSSADNLLESDGNYSEWMSLKSIDGKTPAQPAVYEVKVWRAKKPAYIGSCENLRQKLTLYNLRQNSGHKHLDKFIERNYDEIQVRYEIIHSFNGAKQEVKNRIESFKAQHKNPPAYN